MAIGVTDVHGVTHAVIREPGLDSLLAKLLMRTVKVHAICPEREVLHR